MIRVGDKVMWRDRWGQGYPRPATIEAIEVCTVDDKSGIDVEEVREELKDVCVFDLDNGHWAYGHQIDLPQKGGSQ